VAARKKKTSKKPVVHAKRTGDEIVSEAVRQTRKTRRDKHVEADIWRNRLTLSQQVYDPYLATFQRNREFYVGQQWDDGEMLRSEETEESLLTVNRLLPSLATQNSQIMWKLPWFRVIPRRALGGIGLEQAKVAEMTLNHIMQHPKNNVLLQARLTVLAAHMGYGALKVSYTPDEGVPLDNAEKEEVWGQVITEDNGAGDLVTDVLGGVPWTDPETGEMRRKGDLLLIDTRDPAALYRIDWVDWMDLRHDPEGGNQFEDHGWIAQRMSWRYDEFMENELFTEKDGIESAANSIANTGIMHHTGGATATRKMRFGRGSVSQSADQGVDTEAAKDMMRFHGWQIHDFVNGKVIYMVDDWDRIVGKDSIPRWIDHSPYSFAKLHEVLGEWMPYTEMEAGRPLIRSYNKTRSQVLNHRRRFNRKYEVLKDFVTFDELEKLKDPADGTIVFVEQAGSIVPIQDAPLDQALYKDLELDIRDMSEIFGATPEGRGSSASKTATQAAIIEQRGSSREDDKRTIIGNALSKAAGKLLNALQANLDKKMAVNIVGPSGQAFERHVSRVQLTGDYDVKVEISDMQPNDFATEEARLLKFAQVMGPVAFRSQRWMSRLVRNMNMDDPDMVNELVALFEQAATEELQQQRQEAGGPPEQSGTPSQGRQEGRNVRSIGGTS